MLVKALLLVALFPSHSLQSATLATLDHSLLLFMLITTLYVWPSSLVHADTYNCVDTRELLADHQNDGDDGALSIGGDKPQLSHQAFKIGITHQTAFLRELVRHLLDLTRDIFRLGRQPDAVCQLSAQLLPAKIRAGILRSIPPELDQDPRSALPIVLLRTPSRARRWLAGL